MIGSLPETLIVGEMEYKIRSDYRNVLQIFEIFSDQELSRGEKGIAAIKILFEDFSCALDVLSASDSGFDVEEAFDKITWFISAGIKISDRTDRPTYDWMQDEQMIFSAINDKAKCVDVREENYLHWWTFLGYFNEVDKDSILSFVMGIRNKLNKGKKLEKHEREFLNSNKELVELVERKTKEEIEKKEEYKEIWKGLV